VLTACASTYAAFTSIILVRFRPPPPPPPPPLPPLSPPLPVRPTEAPDPSREIGLDGVPDPVRFAATPPSPLRPPPPTSPRPLPTPPFEASVGGGGGGCVFVLGGSGCGLCFASFPARAATGVQQQTVAAAQQSAYGHVSHRYTPPTLTHTHTHMHTRTRIRVHAHAHAHAHARTRTHMHTHTYGMARALMNDHIRNKSSQAQSAAS
jgi:hypothetical protein